MGKRVKTYFWKKKDALQLEADRSRYHTPGEKERPFPARKRKADSEGFTERYCAGRGQYDSAGACKTLCFPKTRREA